MVLIRPNTTVNSYGIVKWISKLTLQNLRLSMMNYVLIYSSVQIVEEINRLTQINAPSENTTSTGSGMQKSIKSFITVESNWFVQL